jgi:glycosyltransferase involved in cell wall biosynthesis
VNIDLYTIVWNEEEMLPFFFRHYDPFVTRYIVYDDGSTDRTLEMLAAHPRVEVRRFVRSADDSYVLSALALHDNAWKESRGRADWVILTAVDEHLYHPAELGRYLQAAGDHGITAVPALAFQMIADEFPFAGEHLATTRRRGAALDHYNKLSVFNPNAVTETRYAVGRHAAVPEGDIRYPRHDRLLLFHYKFLGMDYLLSRYALLSRGLGTLDKSNKWGAQYDLPRGELEAEFARLRDAAFDVTGRTSRTLIRQKWWRPEEKAGA